MAIIGAILGDIAGSQYEFSRPDDLDWKHCELFTDKCHFTDDTVMTLATKMAILDKRAEYYRTCPFEEYYRKFGRQYPNIGYGMMFKSWINDDNRQPYNSFGNGSAMRCSYIGEHYSFLSDVCAFALTSAKCTHNHDEGVNGAVVTAVCISLAKSGFSKEEIYKYVLGEYPSSRYKYGVDLSLDSYRDTYKWDVTCQGSVPVAIRCFLESEDYESFIRNVLSLPCDTDTLCAIGGGIAEEFYHGTGFDEDTLLRRYLDDNLYKIVKM